MSSAKFSSICTTTYRPTPRVFSGRDRRPTERFIRRQRALDIDFSDPGTLIATGGALFGLAIGIGFPVFMVTRDKADEERVQKLRELNKETYEATGEYISKEEMTKLRPPRWTDRREFVDED